MKKMYMLLMAVLLMVVAGCGGSLDTDTDTDNNTTTTTYSISGTISGPVVSGVTITLSGAASGTTTTSASGNYSFSALSNGSYTVKPSLAGSTFTPVSRGGIVINGASITGQDFTDTVIHDMWIWLSGSNNADNSSEIYGTKGTPAASNMPGARYWPASWIDSSGNLWLFGGNSLGSSSDLNDLWKFDGSNWTWISGSDTINQTGNYGTKGTPASSNVPGARRGAISWIDSSGNLWLFGGWAYDSTGSFGLINDLWKFDGNNWTWVSGSNTHNQSGTYGTKGVPDATNVPGARTWAVSWMDSSGNLWLFGGVGYDSAGIATELNDLWKFDGNNWTWISGSNIGHQNGTYGTKGLAASGNVPGARSGAVSWMDSSDNLWLFGGVGYDATCAFGAEDILNDLWKFDGSNWTWVSGSDTKLQSGTYGTKGTPAAGNVPGARWAAVSWIDSSGNLWLFGGDGLDTTRFPYYLNDLWKFDGSNWTWISGSNVSGQQGNSGTKGTPAATNVPGARDGAVSWMDSSGNLWLFGGVGYDSANHFDVWLNDLWYYKP